jgi:hypothetical protein
VRAVVLDIQHSVEEGFGDVFMESRRRVELDEGDSQLKSLQELVGGHIEAIGLAPNVTAYLNEEGKLLNLPTNHAASVIALAAQAIMPDDWIAGPLVVCGFDPNTGENTDIPLGLEAALLVPGLPGFPSGESEG